jgi:hypothetical protein
VGDAPKQGSAQEDVLSVQPKSANAEKSANPNEPANAAIAIFETASRAAGLVMSRPKPEKRKNAKERAKDKFKEKNTEDGTTPMTATAKSEVESKAKRKAAAKVASKAAKAERKEAHKTKRTAAKAA